MAQIKVAVSPFKPELRLHTSNVGSERISQLDERKNHWYKIMCCANLVSV